MNLTIPLNISFADPCRNQTGRQILLVEPNYNNKYPPLGLMKLSAYHKQLGDEVVFFKGSFADYFFNERLTSCIQKIRMHGVEIENWSELHHHVSIYLKSRRQLDRKNAVKLIPSKNANTVNHTLMYYATKLAPEKKWDRVYVTTLFTFYWKQTIEAIDFAKQVVKSIDSLYVGGVAASLIPDLFAQETDLIVGKNILTGLLDKPKILDDNDIIIDEITPDYSILDTIDHHYPLDTGYLTYMTKGCTRTCSFCAVPKLEPIYKEKISVKDQLAHISKIHGDRKDLILMDNNVLGSTRFAEIVEEILEMGFKKGSTFEEPNRFMILTNYLTQGDSLYNEQKYLEKIFLLLSEFGTTKIKNDNVRVEYYNLLTEYKLDSLTTITKSNVLASKDKVNEFYEQYRNKHLKLRYVDFNQGIDCRYIWENETMMELLSKLPIRPMRIAYDNVSLTPKYEHAVRLADKYGVKELSNYVLFNYLDKPEHLWERLKLNIELDHELKANIFSFPMKFIPLTGDDSKHRKYCGKYWHPKYIRAIQIILTVTNGVVAGSREFFYRAFGKNIDEYYKILMMPEAYIRYRNHFDQNNLTEKWFDELQNLNKKEREYADNLILNNNFFNFNGSTPKAVEALMKQHYQTPARLDPREQLPNDILAYTETSTAMIFDSM